MPKISILKGRHLYSPSGRRLGFVAHVLFHPTEPSVVGFEIRRPNLFYVVERKPRYVAREAVRSNEGWLVSDAALSRVSSDAVAGHSWDETVIWQGMPVFSRTDDRVGVIVDADISLETGAVRTVAVSGGVTSDVAIGRREIAGEHVMGFDGEHVLIEEGLDDVGYSGGVAAAAGKGAAVAIVRGERIAMKAAAYGAATAKAVAESDAAKKVAERAKGAWRSFGRAVRDAIESDDDE